MKFWIKSLNIFTPLRKGSFGKTFKSVLHYLWDVYSVPSPAGKDILTLLFLCFIIAMVTGGLLYQWLSETLTYDREVSIKTACFYSVAIFIFSFLCHPLRCVLTMVFPTVFSKQGRKLIISTALMVLMLNVIPNIAMNIGAVMHILKCTSDGFARTLLNSSDLLNMAKTDLVEETIKVKREELNIVSNLRKFDHFMHIDLSEVKNRFANISGEIENNISYTRTLLKEYKVLSNQILAAISVFLLITESARYLKSYLTSLKFDNVHLSKELLQKITVGNKISSARSTNCKITAQEFSSCFMSLAVVTLYFSAIALITVLDYIVYYLVQISVTWILDFPTINAGITVDFKVYWFSPGICIIPQMCARQELTHFHRDYTSTLGPGPSLCDATPSAPDLRVTALLGSLWMVSYFFVFLEVYARRIRRKVSASFFRKHEEKRISFLLKKMQAKQNNEVFSVNVSFV